MENEDLSYKNIIYDINKKTKMKLIYLDMNLLRIIKINVK